MKVKVSTFAMLLILSVSIFAQGDDGTTHTGGRSCPEGQTCLTIEPARDTTAKENYFFKDILNYLKSLLG
jgi:hypothetical protein